MVLVLGLALLFAGEGAFGQGAGPDADALRQADAAFKAGYAAMQGGRLEQARKDFAETVRLAPDVVEARVALGGILVELGRPEEAVPELERALALRPGDSATEVNLSVAHEAAARKLVRAGKSAEAEAELRAGIAVVSGDPITGPGRTGAGSNPKEKRMQAAALGDELGALLAQERRWAEAEAAFRGALKFGADGGEKADGGSSAKVHMHLGVVLIEEKQMPEALVELSAAVAAEPGNALAQFELGRGLAAAGRDEDAVGHLEEALKLSAGLPGGALELAMAEQRLGKQEASIPHFRLAIEQEPKNAVALANLGLALTQTGKAKEAVPFYARALAEHPEDPVMLEGMGVAELQQSHFNESIGWFEKAIAVDAGNPELHYDLGLAYKLKDQTDDAIRELKKAIELDAKLPDPPYTLGILYMQMGKQEEAAAELRAALELRPGNGDGWAILGSELKQMGKTAEAEAALRKAVELLPAAPGAHITLAGVLAEEGKTADAAAERKIAAGLSKTAVSRQRAEFNTNAGNQALLRGSVGEAVGRYLEAIAADPGYAEAHAQLAVAYERQGRVEEAKAEREKAGGLGAK